MLYNRNKWWGILS